MNSAEKEKLYPLNLIFQCPVGTAEKGLPIHIPQFHYMGVVKSLEKVGFCWWNKTLRWVIAEALLLLLQTLIFRPLISSGIRRSQATSDSAISGASNGSSGNSLFSSGGKSDSSLNEGTVLPSSNLWIYSFLELKSATKNFRADGILGEGGFGGVHKGRIGGTVVAVKKLNTNADVVTKHLPASKLMRSLSLIRFSVAFKVTNMIDA